MGGFVAFGAACTPPAPRRGTICRMGVPLSDLIDPAAEARLRALAGGDEAKADMPPHPFVGAGDVCDKPGCKAGRKAKVHQKVPGSVTTHGVLADTVARLNGVGVTDAPKADDVELEAKADSPLEHKSETPGTMVLDADDQTGVVEALVSVTGVEDRVKDIIEPGAYTKTMATREPIGVWSHDDKTWVARKESAVELMPGDPFFKGLKLPDGTPWPTEAGAVKVKARFNLDTPHGKAAYSDVKFFKDVTSWSIGYRATKAHRNPRTGVRHIKELDWFEFSPVMVGAAAQAMTLSVKSLAGAYAVDPDDPTGIAPESAMEALTADELAAYVELKSALGLGLETKARVRTPEGARRYGVPIGTEIVGGKRHLLQIPAGGHALIDHEGHPYHGQVVKVQEVNPNAVGGVGGGGDVRITRPDGTTGYTSRHTRVHDLAGGLPEDKPKGEGKPSGSEFMQRAADGEPKVLSLAAPGDRVRIRDDGSHAQKYDGKTVTVVGPDPNDKYGLMVRGEDGKEFSIDSVTRALPADQPPAGHSALLSSLGSPGNRKFHLTSENAASLGRDLGKRGDVPAALLDEHGHDVTDPATVSAFVAAWHKSRAAQGEKDAAAQSSASTRPLARSNSVDDAGRSFADPTGDKTRELAAAGAPQKMPAGQAKVGDHVDFQGMGPGGMSDPVAVKGPVEKIEEGNTVVTLTVGGKTYKVRKSAPIMVTPGGGKPKDDGKPYVPPVEIDDESRDYAREHGISDQAAAEAVHELRMESAQEDTKPAAAASKPTTGAGGGSHDGPSLLRDGEKHDHDSGTYSVSADTGGRRSPALDVLVSPPRLGGHRTVAYADGTELGTVKRQGPDSNAFDVSYVGDGGTKRATVRGTMIDALRHLRENAKPRPGAPKVPVTGKKADDLDLEVKAATMAHEPLGIPGNGTNWVEKAGQLPAYIQHIAKDIAEKRGRPLSEAIPIAIGAVKRWARGGGNVDADTRAKAAAAVAEWEALKAKAHLKFDSELLDHLEQKQALVREAAMLLEAAGVEVKSLHVDDQPAGDLADPPAGDLADPVEVKALLDRNAELRATTELRTLMEQGEAFRAGLPPLS